MDAAAFRVTSTSLAISTARAPNAEPSAESVTVERNSAIAATPSIDTVMKATAPPIRSSNCAAVSGAPDSDVALSRCKAARSDRAGLTHRGGWRRPERGDAREVGGDGHRDDGQENEGDDRGQLGDQQPGTSHWADQQVAQRTRGRFACD